MIVKLIAIGFVWCVACLAVDAAGGILMGDPLATGGDYLTMFVSAVFGAWIAFKHEDSE